MDVVQTDGLDDVVKQFLLSAPIRPAVAKFQNLATRWWGASKKRSFLKRDPSIHPNDDGGIGGSWNDVPFATLEKTKSNESDLLQTSMLSGTFSELSLSM